MKIYLAGPMQGYQDFNFPAFMAAAHSLREQGHSVFNPAEGDVHEHGEVFKSATGTLEDVKHTWFSLREELYADTKYICLEAEAIALLPGWENSKGARAEHALAVALGHKTIYL